ncbi:putative major sperm protein (MSP) [Helianthus debilis subsp. tardiflorus]
MDMDARMKPDILEVQPLELKFLFELKKQSSCSVQMINKTNHHVAFKIKTTNPKKYCVRPNTGVIDPNASCDFTVTMQAPKVVPPDMICRDKFLVQSTVVPEGTKEEDVTSNMFAKEDGKIVDEKRLKVIFISPPDSSESSPVNEPSKLVHDNESREVKDDLVHAKVDESIDVSKRDGESTEATRKEETYKRKEPVKRIEQPVKPSHEDIKRNEEFMQMNDTEELILAKEFTEMKSKVIELESRLTEAKATILHLTEEKRSVTQEKHFLQGELDMLKSKRHRAQSGFPLLFVFMVSLVSLFLGYLLHS